MSHIADVTPITDIVKNYILPQVNRTGMAGIFVAKPGWRAGLNLPDGMTMTRKPILDKRVAVRTKHSYGNSFTEEAIWPGDNLLSLRVPKVYYILKYPAAIQVADYVLHCLPGQGIVVPPGIPVTNRFDNMPGRLEMLTISLYQDGLICWYTQFWKSDNKPQVREQSCSIPYSQVSSYLSDLVEEAVSRREHSDVICGSLVKIMFSLLHRELQHVPVLKTGVPDGALSGPRPRTLHPIHVAQKYILRNLREPLLIDDVARHVGMSRTSFTLQFRSRTGKTFVTYLQDLRFNAACELLKGGDLGIRQVAAAAGLTDDRMRALFKEREGMTPTQYRRHSQRIK